MRDIRTTLVGHLHRMPLQFFSGTKTGEIMNRVSNDVDNVDNVVTGTLTSIITNVVLIGTTVVAMFVWNWRLALISVAIVPLMVLPLGPVGRRMYLIRKKTRESRDEIESITQETLSISGITLVKSFARESLERARFYQAGSRLMQLEIDLAMIGRWFLASVTAMVVVGPALVWLGGGWLAILGSLQVGVIVAFVSFIQGRLYGPAAALAGIQVQIVSALAVFERIFEYLDMTPEEYDPPGAIALPDVAGEIAFEDVAFSYDGTRNVLDGISFHVRPGEVAAFVGPVGRRQNDDYVSSCRAFTIRRKGRCSSTDTICDGVTLESLRRNIGIVTQETYLFHDTIATNLRYGKPDATDAELEAAARAANIADFIAALPMRYETVVGRARAQTLRRRASAPRHRARAAEGSADSDSRRGDELARLRERSGDSEGAGGCDARAHEPGDRAPPLDGAGRRRHLRRRRTAAS